MVWQSDRQAGVPQACHATCQAAVSWVWRFWFGWQASRQAGVSVVWQRLVGPGGLSQWSRIQACRRASRLLNGRVTHHPESIQLTDLFEGEEETARAIDWTLCPYLMVFSAEIDPSGGVGAGNTHLPVFRNMPST